MADGLRDMWARLTSRSSTIRRRGCGCCAPCRAGTCRGWTPLAPGAASSRCGALNWPSAGWWSPAGSGAPCQPVVDGRRRYRGRGVERRARMRREVADRAQPRPCRGGCTGGLTWRLDPGTEPETPVFAGTYAPGEAGRRRHQHIRRPVLPRAGAEPAGACSTRGRPPASAFPSTSSSTWPGEPPGPAANCS
jgi:hypothetical protein